MTLPKNKGGVNPPVVVAKEVEQGVLPASGRVVVPNGVKVQVCPSPAYEPCPVDRPIPMRPGAMHYVGRNSI